MESNKDEQPKEEPKQEEQGSDTGLSGISEKELNRDLINLHLPEADLIGNGDFEKTRKEMMERYGDDFFDDEEEDSDDDEEGAEEKPEEKPAKGSEVKDDKK